MFQRDRTPTFGAHAADSHLMESTLIDEAEAFLAGIVASYGADAATKGPFEMPPVPEPVGEPASWDDYIGQPRRARRLEVAISSALARGTRSEHILLTSGPGQGKSKLAELIAAMLGRPIVTLTRPPKSDELLRACERAADGVLFADEVHSWSNAVQEQLMQLTETGAIDGPFGKLHYPNMTVVGATTEPDRLLAPLIDRFGVKIKLDPYTPSEMLRIGVGMIDKCWPVGYAKPGPETCAVLATASAGVPRDLRSLIYSARDLVLSGGEPDANTVLSLCDVDRDGCARVHLDVLELLANSPKGTAGLATLSTMLRTPAEMLRRAERLLLERGLIVLTGSGRVITPAGRARLQAGSIRDIA